MDAATILRSARIAAHCTQGQLAARAGTHQPALGRVESGAADATVGRLNRVLAPAGAQVLAVSTRLPSVAAWSAAFRGWLLEGDDEGVRAAFLQVSDDLRSLDGDIAVALCSLAPAPTGSAGVDAALASLVEYTLTRERYPVPRWARDAQAGHEPYFIVANPSLRDLVVDSTPEVFAKRNVFVPAEFFESV